MTMYLPAYALLNENAHYQCVNEQGPASVQDSGPSSIGTAQKSGEADRSRFAHPIGVLTKPARSGFSVERAYRTCGSPCPSRLHSGRTLRELAALVSCSANRLGRVRGVMKQPSANPSACAKWTVPLALMVLATVVWLAPHHHRRTGTSRPAPVFVPRGVLARWAHAGVLEI